LPSPGIALGARLCQFSQIVFVGDSMAHHAFHWLRTGLGQVCSVNNTHLDPEVTKRGLNDYSGRISCARAPCERTKFVYLQNDWLCSSERHCRELSVFRRTTS